MWSSWTLNSLIHHLLIRHASYNNFLRRMTILPRSTRRRYFGIHTRWYCNRCFVWDPVLYLAMARSYRNLLRFARFHLASLRAPFIPRLESLGFSGSLINSNSPYPNNHPSPLLSPIVAGQFWLLLIVGLPARSRFGEGRCLGVGNDEVTSFPSTPSLRRPDGSLGQS
jgi:hypothetical protein